MTIKQRPPGTHRAPVMEQAGTIHHGELGEGVRKNLLQDLGFGWVILGRIEERRVLSVSRGHFMNEYLNKFYLRQCGLGRG